MNFHLRNFSNIKRKHYGTEQTNSEFPFPAFWYRVALLRQHSQLCRVRHRPAERPSELHQLGLDWHVAHHFARVAHSGRYCPICHRRHLHDSRCNGSKASAQLGGSRVHWWRRVLRPALLGASALLDWHFRRCSLGRCNGFCL